MNYVVFTEKFMPADDPQAFSATRFLSALAERGDDVQVVTTTLGGTVPEQVVRQVLSPKIKITRVQAGRHSLFRRILKGIRGRVLRRRNRKWLGVSVLWEDFGFEDARRELKRVLLETRDPILIVRTFPMTSAIAAYKVAGYAKRVIVHFSDPYPYPMAWQLYREETIRQQLLMGKKILEAADAVTVTCPEVLRTFAREYEKIGYRVDISKFHVVPHIGEPVLEPSAAQVGFDATGLVVVHTGSLGIDRYGRELADELAGYAERGGLVSLVQLGQLEPSFKNRLAASGVPFLSMRTDDPSQTTALNRKAGAILVVDTKTYFDYSPFIPSKFVYALFSDTPIIAYTLPDSPMARLGREHPDAGIFHADPTVKGSLGAALDAVTQSAGRPWVREELRKSYSIRAALDAFDAIRL